MRLNNLKRRIEDLEARGSRENKIEQFPEMRELLRIAIDGDISKMYEYFDAHARPGIYPSVEERRAQIPYVLKRVQADMVKYAAALEQIP